MRFLSFSLSLSLLLITGLTGCGNDAAQKSDNSSTTAVAAPTANNSEVKNTATPTKSLAKIVAFGDSLTAGFGLPTEQSYPALLQKRLDAEGYQFEVINAGVSGDTSAGGVRRLDWALDNGEVKILILELGANDMLRGQPVDIMKKNLSDIIERAQSKGVKVILAGMIAVPQIGPDYAKEFNAAFPEVAQKYNLPLIPFFLENVAGINSLNQPDMIHPNEAGTKIVAENVYKMLKPMLSEAQSASK